MRNDIPDEIKSRYRRETVLQHEALYGRGYQGPGEREVFEKLVARLSIEPGNKVLEIGSGLGGDTFRLVERFDAHVYGLDASQDMIQLANERKTVETFRPQQVHFEHGNVLVADFPRRGPFDVAWSRDTGAFLRHEDKVEAWQRVRSAVRPQGQLLLTDYCVGRSSKSDFSTRMSLWGQHMVTIEEYVALLGVAGWSEIVAEDWTDDLVTSQRYGLSVLRTDQASIIERCGEAVHRSLVERWTAKLASSTSGELSWMSLSARNLG